MQPEESEASLKTDTAEGPSGSPRVLYALLLVLVALLATAGWLLLRGAWTTASAPAGAPTTAATAPPLPTPQGDIPGDGFGIVSGPATPWAVAGGPGEPTPTPEPTLPPAVTTMPVTLLGPPPGSVFRAGDAVSFYWTSPVAAVEGQQFVLYLAVGGENVPLGTVVAPNLGQAYQLQVVPGATVGEAGGYSWFVVLANEGDGTIIAQSETRPITLLAEN